MKETVFDVNIWISYFIQDKIDQINCLIEDNNVYFYRSYELQREFREVINRPKFQKYFPLGTQKFIEYFELVTELYDTIAVFKDCIDPKDNYLFDLAYQANAKYLVSGDKAVLNTPAKRESLKLCTLTEFKTAVQS